MPADAHLLRQSLCDPALTGNLCEIKWDLLVRQARRAGLAPRLRHVLGKAGFAEKIPDQARRHLDTALFVANRHHEALRWEMTDTGSC